MERPLGRPTGPVLGRLHARRDADGPTKDPLYGSARARGGLRKLVMKVLSKELSKRIHEQEVNVEVQVWKDYAQVIVLKR